MNRLAAFSAAAAIGVGLAPAYDVYRTHNEVQLAEERIAVAERVASCAITGVTETALPEKGTKAADLIPSYVMEENKERSRLYLTVGVNHTDEAKPTLEKYADDDTIIWSMSAEGSLLDTTTNPPTGPIPIAGPRGFASTIGDTTPDTDVATLYPKSTYTPGSRISLTVTTEAMTYDDTGTSKAHTTSQCTGSAVMTATGWKLDAGQPKAVQPPVTTHRFLPRSN